MSAACRQQRFAAHGALVRGWARAVPTPPHPASTGPGPGPGRFRGPGLDPAGFAAGNFAGPEPQRTRAHGTGGGGGADAAPAPLPRVQLLPDAGTQPGARAAAAENLSPASLADSEGLRCGATTARGPAVEDGRH